MATRESPRFSYSFHSALSLWSIVLPLLFLIDAKYSTALCIPSPLVRDEWLQPSLFTNSTAENTLTPGLRADIGISLCVYQGWVC